MYFARNHAIKLPFALRTRYKRVDKHALLDSRATENFIHPHALQQLCLPIQDLERPRDIRNVDGTTNKGGRILQTTTLKIQHNGIETAHKFFVADIGPDDFIFGYPFFESARPNIDWQAGRVAGTTVVSSENAAEWKARPKASGRQQRTPAWVKQIPGWEPGDEVWCRTIIGKTTVAQQLAEQATDKVKRTWQELVPRRYHKFSRVFSEQDSEKFPDRRPWDHAIDLKPDAPTSINCRVYPLSPAEKEEQRKFLDQNLRLKRIRRSKSPYASGFFFIKKKDGKFRPVQDYRNLNKWTIPNKYPLPLISELIHKISGKQWFTKLDVRWGYNNVRIKEGDEWKAAFKTSDGLFEPTVMFFGLTNSPATFQTMMDDNLKEEIDKGDTSVYMDDIVIHTDGTLEEHEACVEEHLAKLQKLGLFLKPEKCHFSQQQVEYLGMIVGNGSVCMDPIKVKGVLEWPTPTNLKELRSFLGFLNFYRDFIKDFSRHARPLNDLTCKGRAFIWSQDCDDAFNDLKSACAEGPVLRTPDWNKQFIMQTDASGYTLGVVIQQQHEDGLHPVAFHSRSLLPAERNYDVHDKELAGVIFGFKCARPLFLGAKHPVIVQTDHKNLQYFREPQKISG